MTNSSVPVAISAQTSKRRAPGRRSQRAREAVLEAADDLLVEHGYAALTIEGIAARAGVAKQTIYRWWPSKIEILMDTFLDDAQSLLEIPDTGTTAEDLRRHLRRLARFLTMEPAGRVMLALIGQAQHDRTLATMFQRRYLENRRAVDRTMLERGVARGDVSKDVDLDLLVDVVYGPLYHRVLLTGLPVDDSFVDALVDHVFTPLAGSAPNCTILT